MKTLKGLDEHEGPAGPPPRPVVPFQLVDAPPPIAERSSITTPPSLPAVPPRSKRHIGLLVAGAIMCVSIGGNGAMLFAGPHHVAQAPPATLAFMGGTLLDINLHLTDPCSRPPGH